MDFTELTRPQAIDLFTINLKKLPTRKDFASGNKVFIYEKITSIDSKDIRHYILYQDLALKISEVPESLRFQLILYCVILGYEDKSVLDLEDYATKRFINNEKRILQMSQEANFSDRLLYNFIDYMMPYEKRREQL